MQNELTTERIEASIEYMEEMYRCCDTQTGNVPKAYATAIDALQEVQGRYGGCDFCHRGKPIKAHTYLPDCGLQYGVSVQADFCPVCGWRLTEGSAE